MSSMDTHIPLPAPPLRSAMKHPSRPTTPTSLISPSISPFITRIPLPSASGTATPIGPVSPPSSSAVLPPSISSSPSNTRAPSITHPHSHSHGTPSHQLLSPTPGYTPKVSFDTFENTAASMFSFTLQVKSDGYARTRSTRVFLCASSPDESGMQALDWALEALVQDGDELIVFRGVDEEALERDHNLIREDARDLMRLLQEKSVEYDPERKLSLVLEFIPGKVTDTLDRLIALYRPDSVVVGTRGRRTWQGMGMGMGIGMGSVSKYCLTHSPVPIIVVRPERKVKKAVEKRRANPKRGRHFEDAAKPPPPPGASKGSGPAYSVISSSPVGAGMGG